MRLQGHEASPSQSLWLGVSTIAPGGHTTLSGSGAEKHYVVLEGTVNVRIDAGEVALERHDSCRLAPGERHALHNRTALPALILLAMPFA